MSFRSLRRQWRRPAPSSTWWPCPHSLRLFDLPSPSTRRSSPAPRSRASKPLSSSRSTPGCGQQTNRLTEPRNTPADLTPEVRSGPCERFSRPRSWTRKERSREATEAYAGADHPQVAGGRAAARRGEDDRRGGEGAGDQRADVSSLAGAVRRDEG